MSGDCAFESWSCRTSIAKCFCQSSWEEGYRYWSSTIDLFAGFIFSFFFFFFFLAFCFYFIIKFLVVYFISLLFLFSAISFLMKRDVALFFLLICVPSCYFWIYVFFIKDYVGWFFLYKVLLMLFFPVCGVKFRWLNKELLPSSHRTYTSKIGGKSMGGFVCFMLFRVLTLDKTGSVVFSSEKSSHAEMAFFFFFFPQLSFKNVCPILQDWQI